MTLVVLGGSYRVNAHSGAQAEQAAQTFVDFVARTKQTGLYVGHTGSLSQDQFATGAIP